MKQKIYLIVNQNNKIGHIFLRHFSAMGWLANYKNSLPKQAAKEYWTKYKIISTVVNYPET